MIGVMGARRVHPSTVGRNLASVSANSWSALAGANSSDS